MYRQNIDFFTVILADTAEVVRHVVRVPQFPRFAVSANGRVFREGDRTSSGYRQHGKGWYEVLPHFTDKGYAMVGIWNAKTNKNIRVHRLVADAFLEPAPNPFYEIDHLDGSKTNNHLANLRWVTPTENREAWLWQRNLPAERAALTLEEPC